MGFTKGGRDLSQPFRSAAFAIGLHSTLHDATAIMMQAGSGFVLVEVSRRRRGRPDRHRRVVVDLRDGTRLGFSSSSSPVVVRAVVEAVLGLERRRC